MAKVIETISANEGLLFSPYSYQLMTKLAAYTTLRRTILCRHLLHLTQLLTCVLATYLSPSRFP